MESQEAIAKGQRCIDIEIEALQATKASLDEGFAKIVRALDEAIEKGRKLIFTGIGKNAHVCEKLVATFNSIGAPSCFLDPVRALHGDLGLCCEGDAILAFSNGGETEELLRLIPFVKRFNLMTIAVTSKPASSISNLCDATLRYEAPQEACPLALAPTASTTASIAIGDAVAMVLLELRSFGKEDFAKFHPGGSIGKTLVPRVEKIMRTREHFAQLPDSATCQQCLESMSRTGNGSIALTDSDDKLSGILTDGDIRRIILEHPDFLQHDVSKYMTRSPITIGSDALAVEALKIFETQRIDDLIVVDKEGRPIGLIDGQDLAKLRMV